MVRRSGNRNGNNSVTWKWVSGILVAIIGVILAPIVLSWSDNVSEQVGKVPVIENEMAHYKKAQEEIKKAIKNLATGQAQILLHLKGECGHKHTTQ